MNKHRKKKKNQIFCFLSPDGLSYDSGGDSESYNSLGSTLDVSKTARRLAEWVPENPCLWPWMS